MIPKNKSFKTVFFLKENIGNPNPLEAADSREEIKKLRFRWKMFRAVFIFITRTRLLFLFGLDTLVNSADQVRNLLRGCTEGLLECPVIEETLGINKSRFFALLRINRNDPEAFTISYHRSTPRKLSAASEEEIKKEG
ncbi:MAG: hypothetical protein WCC06_02285 [Candidatus Aminicenantales bacterium]